MAGCLLTYPPAAAVEPPADSAATVTDSLGWWPRTEVETALSYIRMTGADLSLRNDYMPRDSCRLPGVDRLMRQPPAMPGFLAQAAGVFFPDSAAASRGGGPLNLASPWESLGAMGLTAKADTNGSAPRDTLSFTPGDSTRRCVWPGSLSRSPQWQRFLSEAAAALSETHWVDSIIGGLSPADRRFVLDDVQTLIMEDVNDRDKSPEVLDSIQKLEDGYAARFATLAAGVRWRWVWRHGGRLMDRLLASVPPAAPVLSRHDGKSAPEVYTCESPFGRVIVGTPGPDYFRGDAALIIDPGGDDIYELDSLLPGQHRCILDYGGDDTYLGTSYDLGSARFGWSLLVDFQGDDLYRAGSFSLGAGWFGAGGLFDLAGRDVYIGDVFTEGAGAFGIGILYDAGNDADQYTGRLCSQGFGFAAGMGVLADFNGNDLYAAGGKYEDILRYRDHYVSLSQGFGYGMRPHFSGGIGLLLDRRGNDTYVADIFGQGCSYWWSFGGLYDIAGNDHYAAYQYAQGSATHLTAGCLFDAGGNDRYDAKGVSQGCGHDWAVGVLIDRAGDDRYAATDLSQAAGSANGIGVLIDGAGDDGYYVVSPVNTQGYGNPRRQYGSIGLFLDLGGSDHYDGPGAEGTVWLSRSKWGVGVDADSAWERIAAGRKRSP